MNVKEVRSANPFSAFKVGMPIPWQIESTVFKNLCQIKWPSQNFNCAKGLNIELDF